MDSEIYLFICSLFNDALTNILSCLVVARLLKNSRKDEDRSGRGLDWKKTTKT